MDTHSIKEEISLRQFLPLDTKQVSNTLTHEVKLPLSANNPEAL